MRRATRAAALVAALLLSASACGAKSSDTPAKDSLEKAADRTVCVKDAHPVGSYPAGFPKAYPFPPSTVVYNVEDRGKEGVIATGVTRLPFKQVLAALTGPAQKAGYKVTSGETETHDAEANWTGHGYRGRWAIRESGTCTGETVVQVLATRG